MSGFRYLWSAISGFRAQAVVLLIVIVLTALAESLGIWLILPFLEFAINPQDITNKFPALHSALSVFEEDDYLLVISLLLFVVVLVKLILTMLQTYLGIRFTTRVRGFWEGGAFRNYIYSKFSSLSGFQHGRILNNVLQEPVLASKSIRGAIDFVAKLILSISIFLVALIVDWQKTLILSAFLLLIIFSISNLINRYSTSIGERKIRINQDLNETVSESFSGIRQIKIFGMESSVVSQFKGELDRLFNLLINIGVVSQVPKVVGELLMFAIIISVILVNSYILQEDVASIIPIMGFYLFAFQRLFTNISALVSMKILVESYLPSMRLVDSIVKDEHNLESSDGESFSGGLQQEIDFQDVSFSYEKTPILKELNFKIPKNSITGLVGASGSGKSTICDLLMGFYQPESGKITIDGNGLQNIRLSDWRKTISYISQDTFLFNVSIKQNILFGRSEATDDEIQSVLDIVVADAFAAELSSNENPNVGHGGNKLSGGQRQRIAIARALIRDSDILVFDESTSALDNTTEKKIIDLINNLKGRKTIILIAHKLQLLKSADNIVVLDKGRIVEQGPYNELENGDGLFSKLLNAEYH